MLLLSFTSTLTQEWDTSGCLGWCILLTLTSLAMVNRASFTKMEDWRFGLDLRITDMENPMAQETLWAFGTFPTEDLSRLVLTSGTMLLFPLSKKTE